MKQSLKFVTMMAFAVLALTSCQKEEINAPDSKPSNFGPPTDENGLLIGSTLPTIGIRMMLHSRGIEDVNYMKGPGISLVNVIWNTKTKGTTGYFTPLQPNGSGPAWTQFDNLDKKIIKQRTYLLSNDSLTTFIKTNIFDPNERIISTYYDSLEYNAERQLIKHRTPTGYYELQYNGSGDMITRKDFKSNGQLITTTGVTYSTRGFSLEDKNDLNHDYLSLDRYVRFFGKPSKHLPLRIITMANGVVTSDVKYEYTFFATGLIKTQKTTNTVTNQIIESLDFTYKPY